MKDEETVLDTWQRRTDRVSAGVFDRYFLDGNTRRLAALRRLEDAFEDERPGQTTGGTVQNWIDVAGQPTIRLVAMLDESVAYDRHWTLPFHALSLCVRDNGADPSWAELPESARRRSSPSCSPFGTGSTPGPARPTWPRPPDGPNRAFLGRFARPSGFRPSSGSCIRFSPARSGSCPIPASP